jgi:ribosome recycling factor
MAPPPPFDLSDIKRRMQGAVTAFKQDLSSLRTGRASPSLLDPIQVDSYGATMSINQVATVSVPESRLLSVQVWDRGMVAAVEKAIRDSDLGLNPQTEGQVIRLRIPEMNEQRRKEMVKVANKYAEEARVATRHVRRDGIDLLKKLEKDGHMSEDDQKRHADQVQKETDKHIAEIDAGLVSKEKEIMQV